MNIPHRSIARRSQMMAFRLAVIVVVIGSGNQINAQELPITQPAALPPTLTLNLWPGPPPIPHLLTTQPATRPARASTRLATRPATRPIVEHDDGTGRIFGVSIPAMLVYLPTDQPKPAGRTAIIVCPGGGYSHLTRLVGADGMVNESLPRGVVIISLKYRLIPPAPNLPTVAAEALLDGQRAVRLVRAHAAEWQIDPHRVGLLGWSAGANLGINIATHFDDGNPQSPDTVEHQSDRPDFVALLSPWPARQTIGAYPVTKNSPPAFICSARDDRTAPVSFAQAIAAAYDTAGATEQLWLIDKGGHAAFEIGNPGEGSGWLARFWPWLSKIGMYDQ
jgi:endo-1,4-beta-xylanase